LDPKLPPRIVQKPISGYVRLSGCGSNSPKFHVFVENLDSGLVSMSRNSYVPIFGAGSDRLDYTAPGLFPVIAAVSGGRVASMNALVSSRVQNPSQNSWEILGSVEKPKPLAARLFLLRSRVLGWQVRRMITGKVTCLDHCISTVKVLLIFFALALCPTSARANSVDQSIVVNTAVDCGINYFCVPIIGLTFSFSTTGAPHQVLHYTNMSGVNWYTLTLTEVGEPAIDITCTSNLFGCQIVPYGNHGARIILRAFGNFPGVAVGKSFEIGFGCKGDCLPWPDDLAFTAVANGTAPEPATAPMLLLGVAFLFAGMRPALRYLTKPDAQRPRRELR
jgi:hypothetical protein